MATSGEPQRRDDSDGNCRRTVGSCCGMELMASDMERIPRPNLRIPVLDFGRLWVEAERRADQLVLAGGSDGYLTGVLVTCRWLACVWGMPASPTSRAGESARSPITGRSEAAYEELIADEVVAAEQWQGREWPGLLGYVEGVNATLAWAWRRSGKPPIDVAQLQAG